MARIASPWFWEERNGWYVNRDAQRHFLGGHPAGAPAPRKGKGKWNVPEPVRQAFHDLMAERKKNPPAAAAVAPGLITVAGLFDKCLEWCQKNRAASTFDGYVWHLQRFCDHLKAADEIAAADLRPYHVAGWIDAHPDWGPTYRRNAIASIKRAYSWAEELGYVDPNPVRKIKKPVAARREQVVTQGEFETIRGHYAAGDPFRDLLDWCWESGARPQEAKRVEARHLDLERHRIVFPKEESKGKKKARVIHLTAAAEEVVARLAAARPSGPLFLNEDGNPWTTSAMNCRFCRLQKKLGVKYAAYAIRHGFCQRLLVAGVSAPAVAALMGHQDANMIHRVYSHLSEAEDHLKEALKKDADKRSA